MQFKSTTWLPSTIPLKSMFFNQHFMKETGINDLKFDHLLENECIIKNDCKLSHYVWALLGM